MNSLVLLFKAVNGLVEIDPEVLPKPKYVVDQQGLQLLLIKYFLKNNFVDHQLTRLRTYMIIELLEFGTS